MTNALISGDVMWLHAQAFLGGINPLIFLVTLHQCKAANYCPHTVHDIFDHGGLAIAYNNATDPVGFCQNNMQHIWHGHFLNAWAFSAMHATLTLPWLWPLMTSWKYHAVYSN